MFKNKDDIYASGYDSPTNRSCELFSFSETRNDEMRLSQENISQSRKSLLQERRILDKIPRNDRLKSRTPWGSLDVLDDYGLLDGGNSVPNYYTSLRQRHRRCLEMKARSSRLRDRGKQSTSMILESLYHMLRVLIRRGINIEDYCRERDSDGRGILDKKLFWKFLSSLGLPFRPRDIDEVVRRYTVQSSDCVDYESLLRDANLLSQSFGDSVVESDSRSNSNTDDSFNGLLGIFSSIMNQLKQELLDSLQLISIEDLYRKFAKYDINGTGTITATQFFRVLSQLHIECLEDQKQDYLVELLDIHNEGRINFEVFLSYCFAERLAPSNYPYGMTMRSLYGGTNTRGHATSSVNDSLSITSSSTLGQTTLNSQDMSTKLNSSALNGLVDNYTSSRDAKRAANASTNKQMRPHTASAYRSEQTGYNNGLVQSGNHVGVGVGGAIGAGIIGASSSTPLVGSQERVLVDISSRGYPPQRPMTASARVPNTPTCYDTRYRHHRREGHAPGDEFYIIERDEEDDDDFIADDDGDGLGNMSFSLFSDDRSGDRQDVHGQEDGVAVHTECSNSPEDERPAPGKDPDNGDGDGDGDGREQQLEGRRDNLEPNWWGADSESEPTQESYVRRALASIRELILVRNRDGKRLRDIFIHFERRGSGFFDAVDLRRAAADLRVELTLDEAAEAASILAIDGDDKVSYGEFLVFVTDADHHELQARVQQAAAEQLERLGQSYGEKMSEVFLRPEHSKLMHGLDNSMPDTVTPSSFSKGLAGLGLELTASDVSRLVARFDVHGVGLVSVSRFLRMVQDESAFWARTLLSLTYYEMAREEQQEALRLLLAVNTQATRGPSTGGPGPVSVSVGGGSSLEAVKGLDEGVVEMAAYLGIGVFSEAHMMWIAAKALNAPLPEDWVAQVDSVGRTVFINRVLQKSRYDHPLDPYFRKLRDQERFGPLENNQNIDGPLPHFQAFVPQKSVKSETANQVRCHSASSITNRPNERNPAYGHMNRPFSSQNEAFEGSATLTRPRPRPKSAFPTTRAALNSSLAVKWYEERIRPIPRQSQVPIKPILKSSSSESTKLFVPSLAFQSAFRPSSAPYLIRPPKPNDTYTYTDDSLNHDIQSSRQGDHNDLLRGRPGYPLDESKVDTAQAQAAYRGTSSHKKDPALRTLSPYIKNSADPKFSGTASNKRTVVERAINKTHYTEPTVSQNSKLRPLSAVKGQRREDKREQKLATMYKDDLLGQLDAIMAGRR